MLWQFQRKQEIFMYEYIFINEKWEWPKIWLLALEVAIEFVIVFISNVIQVKMSNN